MSRWIALLPAILVSLTGCGGPSAAEAKVILAKETGCLENLRNIGSWTEQFRAKESRYPASMAELRNSVFWKSDPRCGFAGVDKGNTYLFATPPVGSPVDPDWILVYDWKAHSDGKRGVFRVGGRAELISDDEFRRYMGLYSE